MMIEFVFWSFAVALLPMFLDLGMRTLTATAEILWWTSDRMVKYARNVVPAIHPQSRADGAVGSCQAWTLPRSAVISELHPPPARPLVRLRQ